MTDQPDREGDDRRVRWMPPARYSTSGSTPNAAASRSTTGPLGIVIRPDSMREM